MLTPNGVDFLPVGGDDVNFVCSYFGVEEFPDDFVVFGDFEDFGFGGIFLGVGSDDDVAVGHALRAAGVLESVAGDFGVV